MSRRRTPLPCFLGSLVLLIVAQTAARGEVLESTTTYESQGKAITVERFEPKGEGKFPGVAVVHGSGGIRLSGPMARGLARHLAERGYVTHLIHYFDLTGTEIANLATIREHFRGCALTVADGISHLAKQPKVDPRRIGLLGFSLGSYLSLAVAMYDPRVRAVVEFFGGLPEILAKDLKRMPPTLILHGDADLIVPVQEARTLERLFRERSLAYEAKIYAGQGHGFTGDDQRDAHQRALTFFDKHVRNAAAATKAGPTVAERAPSPGAAATGAWAAATLRGFQDRLDPGLAQ